MSNLKGWYYDKQLNSPLTSVTLHANMWWDGGEKKFINWDQIEGENGFGKNGGDCDTDEYSTILGYAPEACGYGLDPICTSILNEDFSVAISNTWSEFGGDPIGQAWNDLRGPLSGVSSAFVNAGKTLLGLNEKTLNESNRGETQLSTLAHGLSNIVYKGGRKVIEFAEGHDIDVVSFLNKALITNGTRFSYYGGTGVGFGNLSMKFTVFPKWENKKFIEVTKQVTQLYPYFIGQLESFEEATNLKTDENDFSYPGMAKYMANTCFWFQKPPGGYQTEMKDVDIIQKGTLKLKIGHFYEIPNLLCSDIVLNFSKNMVKNPETDGFSPLFCDVSVTLRPSTKFTDRTLRAFVGGNVSSKNALARLASSRLSDERTKVDDLIKNVNYVL